MKLIIGGSGGVGKGLLSAWVGQPSIATYCKHAPPQSSSWPRWLACDVTALGWAEKLLDQVEVSELDTIVVSTGMLHNDAFRPEKSIREFDREWFASNMALNTQPFAELAAELTRRLNRKQTLTVAVLSAKVGSIEDNRIGGWYSYRASKAALNMLVKCTAIEWRHRLPNVTLLALHPGTTDSGLSQPFHDRLPEGQLHSQEQTGNALAKILHQATPDASGQLISWDGNVLPW